MAREKWSADRLAYTADQRQKIMRCIQRLNARETQALDRAVLKQGGHTLPRPYVREQLRSWFRARWTYLIGEYEKVLPHVEEIPDEPTAPTMVHRGVGGGAYPETREKAPPHHLLDTQEGGLCGRQLEGAR